MAPYHALAYHSRDPRGFPPAWQPRATLLEAVLVGPLEEVGLKLTAVCPWGLEGSLVQ